MQLHHPLTRRELEELRFLRGGDTREQRLLHVVDLVSGVVQNAEAAAPPGWPRCGVDDACALDVLGTVAAGQDVRRL